MLTFRKESVKISGTTYTTNCSSKKIIKKLNQVFNSINKKGFAPAILSTLCILTGRVCLMYSRWHYVIRVKYMYLRQMMLHFSVFTYFVIMSFKCADSVRENKNIQSKLKGKKEKFCVIYSPFYHVITWTDY